MPCRNVWLVFVTLVRPEKLPVAASAKIRICWNWSGPDEVSGASRPGGVGGGPIMPGVGFSVGLGITIAGSVACAAGSGCVGPRVVIDSIFGGLVASVVDWATTSVALPEGAAGGEVSSAAAVAGPAAAVGSSALGFATAVAATAGAVESVAVGWLAALRPCLQYSRPTITAMPVSVAIAILIRTVICPVYNFDRRLASS